MTKRRKSLTTRVVDALRLSDFTIAELARLLGADRHSIEVATRELRARGAIGCRERAKHPRGGGRRPFVFHAPISYRYTTYYRRGAFHHE